MMSHTQSTLRAPNVPIVGHASGARARRAPGRTNVTKTNATATQPGCGGRAGSGGSWKGCSKTATAPSQPSLDPHLLIIHGPCSPNPAPSASTSAAPRLVIGRVPRRRTRRPSEQLPLLRQLTPSLRFKVPS